MSRAKRTSIFFSRPIGFLIVSMLMYPLATAAEVIEETKTVPLPAGIYSQSCIELKAVSTHRQTLGKHDGWDMKSLHGKCKTLVGTWNYTYLLDFDYCQEGSIANMGGSLACKRKETAKPPGSWSQSCVDAYVRESNNTLVASCRNKGGAVNSTSLALSPPCGTSIVNNDGVLKCLPKEQLPGGSWTLSCNSPRIVFSQLEARCRDRNGQYQLSRLYLPCDKPVSNLNGHLICGGVADLLGGSWYQSCRNLKWDGTTLFAECRTKSDKWRDNTIVPGQCKSKQAWNNNGYLTCH